MTVAEQVFEEVKALPDSLAREVLNFAGFLRSRGERAEWRDLMTAQECSLAAVWDHEDDGVWDDL